MDELVRRVYGYIRRRGEVRVAELEERFGPGMREVVARLWAEGRVRVVGDRRGPLPGVMRVSKQLVRKYGARRIPAEAVEKRYGGRVPVRFVKWWDRSSGKPYYMLLIRGDDIVQVRKK